MIQATSKWINRSRLSPLKSVRLYCKTVCGGSAKEVRLCTTAECPLYAYRFGRNPSRCGVGGCQRSRNGQFLPKTIHSRGEIPTMTPQEGLDMGEAVLARLGSNMNGSGKSKIEAMKGEVQIEKTSSGLLIRLTQDIQESKDEGR